MSSAVSVVIVMSEPDFTEDVKPNGEEMAGGQYEQQVEVNEEGGGGDATAGSGVEDGGAGAASGGGQEQHNIPRGTDDNGKQTYDAFLGLSRQTHR